jgi:hypothetical protein
VYHAVCRASNTREVFSEEHVSVQAGHAYMDRVAAAGWSQWAKSIWHSSHWRRSGRALQRGLDARRTGAPVLIAGKDGQQLSNL